jgi:hypothetical protein
MHILVDKEVSAARMAICETCEFYGMPDAKLNWLGAQRCQKCSCYMPMKTTLARASCPVGKWSSDEKLMNAQQDQESKIL